MLLLLDRDRNLRMVHQSSSKCQRMGKELQLGKIVMIFHQRNKVKLLEEVMANLYHLLVVL